MEKIWFSSYPLGVPETIDVDQYPSLLAAFNEYCAIYAEKTAFSNFGTQLSYQQLNHLSCYLAAYFQHTWNLVPGERVAIMMPNLLQYPVALYAILRSGLIVVNINPRYQPRELKLQLADAKVKAIIIWDRLVDVLREVLPDIPIQYIMVTQIGDLMSGVKSLLFNWFEKLKFRQLFTISVKIEKLHCLKKAIKIGENLSYSEPPVSLETIALLQYTSGATGQPKGVILSHRNILANTIQCLTWMRDSIKIGQEVILIPLPLYHIFSLQVSFVSVACGAHCVLITDPRDINSLISTWRKNSVSILVGINTLFLHLLKHPSFKDLNFQSLKLTVAGGMATQEKIAQQWQKITDCVVTEGYGLTEASPIVCINPLTATVFNGSIGLPVPDTEIKICNGQGEEVAIDHVGELWVKGPQVMCGYWQNPQQTAEVLDQQGWLHTGDLVRMDAQGFIYFVARKKEIIVVSGFNVCPREVEEVIASLPGVAEVLVIGIPSEATGEMVKAIVVKADPKLTSDTIIDFCRHQLALYKIPKQIEFQSAISKNLVSKY